MTAAYMKTVKEDKDTVHTGKMAGIIQIQIYTEHTCTCM